MTVQITNAIRDCGPRYAQGLGTISSAMKHSEKMTPKMEFMVIHAEVSLLRRTCTKVAAEVKPYPIAAPMEDISTTQLSTVRPNHGQHSEMIMMNRMAFIGVL